MGLNMKNKYTTQLLIVCILFLGVSCNSSNKVNNVIIGKYESISKNISYNKIMYISWDKFSSNVFDSSYLKKNQLGDYEYFNGPIFIGYDGNRIIFFLQENGEFKKNQERQNLFYYSFNASNFNLPKKILQNPYVVDDTGAKIQKYIYFENKSSDIISEQPLNSEIYVYNSSFEEEKKYKLMVNNEIKFSFFQIKKNQLIIPNRNIIYKENGETIKLSNSIDFIKYCQMKKNDFIFDDLMGNQNSLYLIFRKNKTISHVSYYDYSKDFITEYYLNNYIFYDFYGFDRNNNLYFGVKEWLKYSVTPDDVSGNYNNIFVCLNPIVNKYIEFKHQIPNEIQNTNIGEFYSTDYQVTEEGEVYCCIMHKKGVYILKFKPEI